MRKEEKLQPKDKISLIYSGDNELNKILDKNKAIIQKDANAVSLELKGKEKRNFAAEKELTVGRQKLWLAIKII